MLAIETLDIVDEIEEFLELDRPRFFGFVRLDEDHLTELVRRLRASLPSDLEHALRLTENSDRLWDSAQTEAARVIGEARLQARSLIDDAQREAERLRTEAHEEIARQKQAIEAQAAAALEQSEITRIATAQAREIVTQAEKEARELREWVEAEAAFTRAGADDYALEVLSTLEQQIVEATKHIEGRMTATLSAIQRGRTVLENRRQSNEGMPKTLPRTVELMTGRR